MNNFTYRILVYTFLTVILFSCTTKSNINLDDIDKWEEKSIIELFECCPKVKGTVTEFMLLSYFKDNLRYRAFNEISILKDVNCIEIIEEYYEGNNAYISIFLKEENLKYSFIYYKDRDKLEKYENDIKLNNIIKNKFDCCDLNGSHNHIFFYSKLKIKNNKIEILDTYSF